MSELIETQEALERQIKQWGFMPFFKNGVEGFCIEEIMPSDLLFGEPKKQREQSQTLFGLCRVATEEGVSQHGAADEVGAWQWKGPIISHWEAAYGKFFAGKAGFVSLEWLPDLMNWRRKQYPLSKMDEETGKDDIKIQIQLEF